MEETGADGSPETQSTWSDSEAEKNLQPLECELEELRAMNYRQEQELRQLRKILVYTEYEGSGNEVPAGGESVALLKCMLSTRDVAIAGLEQSLCKQQQELADELAKRKQVQYKLIRSGREVCDLLHKCSEYHKEVMTLELENLALRQSAGQKPTAKPTTDAMPGQKPTAKPTTDAMPGQKPAAKPTMDAMRAHSPVTVRRNPITPGWCRSPSKTPCDKDNASNWAYACGVWQRRAGSFSLPVGPGIPMSPMAKNRHVSLPD